LPLTERFDIPDSTRRAIEETRATGGRVVAVGTTVVRALEGCAAQHGGRVVAGVGETDLLLGASTELAIVDGILTGLHEPGTSHFELLRAFAPRRALEKAMEHAEGEGYLGHEFGDSMVIV
jgi:S-adenosylmethionine:tRNA ribosyltransferase-isomerase